MTDNSGLLYMRARYYNPYLCRFINPDPTGFSAGLNFYAYANGNPVSYLDPFGLNVGATGDNSWSWTSIYNSIANLVVPGQAALNNAYSSFQAGNYWTSALNVANAVGQDVLFALTAGGSSVATSGLNAAGGSITTLGENDVVIGFVQNGQIIGQSSLGSDFATALSHEQLASQLGILESPGVLSDGAEAFTVWSENGQIMIRGSNNFVPTVSPTTQTILQQLFR